MSFQRLATEEEDNDDAQMDEQAGIGTLKSTRTRGRGRTARGQADTEDAQRLMMSSCDAARSDDVIIEPALNDGQVGAEDEGKEALELDDVALEKQPHPQRQGRTDGATKALALSTAAIALPVLVGSSAAASMASTPPAEPQYKFRSLLLLFLVVIADGIALHIIVPFISPMCEERFGVAPEAVGAAAGLLLGSFSLAVLLSSFALGHLSDLYGRRSFLLMGLATSVVCPLLFGWTTSFGVALASRVLSGLTNANLVLTKTVISDVPNSQLSPERRALSFAYLSGVFQLSRALASALAGVAVGYEIFGYANPYFLPCLLAGLFNLVVLLLCWIYLPESLKSKPKPSKAVVAPAESPSPPSAIEVDADTGATARGAVQMTRLRAPAPRAQSSKYERVLDVVDVEDGVAADVSVVAMVEVSSSVSSTAAITATSDVSPIPALKSPSHSPESATPFVHLPSSPAARNNVSGLVEGGDAAAASTVPPADLKGDLLSPPSLPVSPVPQRDDEQQDEHHQAPGCAGTLRYVWTRLVLGMRVVWRDILLRKLILLQCLHAYANGSFMLLLSLFGALELSDRGMAISPAEIGACYVAFGLVSLAFQLFVYKSAHKKLGLYRLYLVGTLLLGIAAALLPLAGLIKSWEVDRARAAFNSQAAGSVSSGGDDGSDSDSTDGSATGAGGSPAVFDPTALPGTAFWVSWCYLALSLVGMACGFMICLPVIGGMMSLAVQGSSFRGLTLGVSQSAMSGCRGLGATVMGALFSYVSRRTGWPALVFWMLACLNFTAFGVAWHFTPTEIKISCTGTGTAAATMTTTVITTTTAAAETAATATDGATAVTTTTTNAPQVEGAAAQSSHAR